MWRNPFGRHAQLRAELETTRSQLKQAQGELHKSFAIRRALAERCIELESELKGIRWTLERFFERTQFWSAIERFMGQEKGASNDIASSKRNTYR
jgi:hypothetical protein